jgi:hypothetical protein
VSQKLTGEQYQKFQEALLDAYDYHSLARMLRFQLDRDLAQLTAPGSLDNVVFQLIAVAEQEGWTQDLLAAACKSNPGNTSLQDFGRQFGAASLSEQGANETGSSPPSFPTIDPDDPPFAALRDLMQAAFTAEDLRRFCQERKVFRPLLAQFGPGQGLGGMVDRVIDFCGARLLWAELLTGIAEENPRQFARFERELRGDG